MLSPVNGFLATVGLRNRARRKHRKEFEATGVYDVRLKADGINYLDAEKLNDAREWLYEKENKYQRRADLKSSIAFVTSLLALVVSGYSAYNARNSDRAWVSPTTMNEVHRTAFCFKYDAKNAQEDDNGRPVMNSCNHGHYAN